MRRVFLVFLLGFAFMGDAIAETIADEYVWSISGRAGSGNNYCEQIPWYDGRELNSDICMISAEHARITLRKHATTGRGLITVFVRPYAEKTDPLFLKMVVPSELKISRMFPLSVGEIDADEASNGGVIAEVLKGIPGSALEIVMGNYSIVPGLLASYQTAGDPSLLEQFNNRSEELDLDPILTKQLYPYQSLEMSFKMTGTYIQYTFMSTQSYENTVSIINQYGFSVYYAGSIDEVVLENIKPMPVEEPTYGLIPYYETDSGWRVHAKRFEEDGGGDALELLTSADPRNFTGSDALLVSGGDVCLYLEWTNATEPYSPWAGFTGFIVDNSETEVGMFFLGLSPSEVSPTEDHTCSGGGSGLEVHSVEPIVDELVHVSHAGAAIGLRTEGGVFLISATYSIMDETVSTELSSGMILLP